MTVSDKYEKRLQEQASKFGLSDQDFLDTVLAAWSGDNLQKMAGLIDRMRKEAEDRIDPAAKAFLEENSNGWGIPGSQIIETLILNYGALQMAYEYGGMDQPGWTSPFLVDKEGDLATGYELLVYLTKRYVAKFFEKDTVKRDEIFKKIDKDFDDVVYVELYRKGKNPDQK